MRARREGAQIDNSTVPAEHTPCLVVVLNPPGVQFTVCHSEVGNTHIRVVFSGPRILRYMAVSRNIGCPWLLGIFWNVSQSTSQGQLHLVLGSALHIFCCQQGSGSDCTVEHMLRFATCQ